MGRKRRKQSSTYGSLGRFMAIPFSVVESQRYLKLTHRARALLVDLLLFLNGSNNGDIAAAQKLLAGRGWTDSTRKRALKELVDNGLLVLTRQGGKNRPSLYAFSWLTIDECKVPLELGPTKKPWIDFRGENAAAKYARN